MAEQKQENKKEKSAEPKNRFAERLTHNLDLKILALVFSVILWLIVVNIDDPVKSVQFSGVNVQILHASELEKQGMCYEVLDGTDNITVTITGRRSVIEEISVENISATADMKDLTSMNTISIKVVSTKSANDLDNIKSSSENVKLNVEKLMKSTERIVVETEGTPAEDYITGTKSVDLNQVEISGPESVVSTVAEAKAILNVDNASSNVSASVPIYLFDAQGNRVESTRIKLNITNVNINQEILYSKTVPVEYEFNGTPEEGYALTDDVITDCDRVWICGRKNLLDNINKIAVRGEALNVDGRRTNLTVSLDLEDYLPASVGLADKNFDGWVTATVLIRKETYTIITKELSSITFAGLPEGKSAEILEEGDYVQDGKLLCRLYGLSERIGEVDERILPVYMDFDAYKAENNLADIQNGVYTIAPTMDLPEGVRMENGCVLHVRVFDQ